MPDAPPTAFDESMIRRALSLAAQSRGRVEPNPMVGCVIVKDGRIIGEGRHEYFGGPHAEPNALANCTESPEGATAYVTLEPCCHTNKKTPPCAPRLIEARLARVVVGTLDPNPAVNGNGLVMLRAAGISVTAPVLEPDCNQLIAPFLARTRHRRPYVTLKWAETADRKIAGPGGARLQISNPLSSRLVHELRARSDAILVGVRTVISDDPLLTARDIPSPRPLIRIVLDPDLRIPVDSRLVTTASAAPVIVYCAPHALDTAKAALATLRGFGVDVRPAPLAAPRGLSIQHVLTDLPPHVTHVLVEPGPSLASSLLATDLADRVWVFRSPRRLDDPHAPSAWPVSYPPTATLTLAGDTLTEYLNPSSPLFFSPTESPDLLLARQSALLPTP